MEAIFFFLDTTRKIAAKMSWLAAVPSAEQTKWKGTSRKWGDTKID